MSPNSRNVFAAIGPGILVAATGVGAGDLATSAFAGINIGLSVMWVVLLGAFLKYVINEGLARWQLATEETLLEGSVKHLGTAVKWIFLPYMLVWSLAVGVALMSAVGVVCSAFVPGIDPKAGKIGFGVAHSLIAVAMVLVGGFKLFHKVMSVCIGVMFAVVVVTAWALRPDVTELLAGMFVPSIPAGAANVGWTVGLMGGVGGTLTVLCYGYWMRECSRAGEDSLGACRIDLVIAYVMTAIFGICMLIIGSRIELAAGFGGARLIVSIAEGLENALGPIGPFMRWAFLVGAWGAVFSSLLGVWQSVPYLFADVWRLIFDSGDSHPHGQVNTAGRPYRCYLFAIATLPIPGLFLPFEYVQKTYAILGAFSIPLIAAALLILNGRKQLVGKRLANSRLTSCLLIVCLTFFLGYSIYVLAEMIR